MLGFSENIRKYNGKKLIAIKLGFCENVRKYDVKKTYRDKAWILGQLSGNIMVKKLLEIKLGFWDNVRKYNHKKLLEIKLGFWDMETCCKPRF